MRIITEQLTATGVLTGYLLDASPEMATATTRPAVLVLPGGGYEFCSDREAEPVAAAYLAEGFHAFVLRYAVGPHAPWEASFTDAGAALDWLRDHAQSRCDGQNQAMHIARMVLAGTGVVRALAR